MRFWILVSIFTIFGVSAVNAQVRNAPTPTPTPISTIQRDDQKNISRRSDDLRMTENLPVVPLDRSNKVFRQKIRPIYRKSNKNERALLSPDETIVSRYAAFLKGKNTGLTKLIIDQGCDKDPGVVVSTEHCLKYSMPGAGTSYSFRYDDYRIKRLSDINYTGKLFQSVGVLTHGIFVDIGDIPIEEVTLNTKGAEYLREISPAKTFADATDLITKLEKGIEKGEFTYKNYVPLKENTTYVLRSIAYRGKSYRTVEGITYNELEFDKRKDVIVSFRVVDIAPDESATIIWKELANKKAPKIKPNK